MRILINTPLITIPAGVSNHFLGLKPYFSQFVIYNQYLTNNYIKTKITNPFLYKIIRIITFFYDILKFIFLIIRYKFPLVLLNPSFGYRALKRDVIFLKIAKLFRCKVAVLIHGWDKEYLESVFLNQSKFSTSWKKADAFFVLANEFKEYLNKLGIVVPIHLTTTKVNDLLLEGVPEVKETKIIQNILFLARVEKAKGIITTIDTFKLLQDKFPSIKLRVVGSGNMLENAKEYAEKYGLSNITFTGPLFGSDLKAEYLNADLYILPTTHGEGMPTSVLEAMAFGLPVITRPVGGLKDFFENVKMGYMIESIEPSEYAHQIELLINDIERIREISAYNKQYSKDHFMASQVAHQLEESLKLI